MGVLLGRESAGVNRPFSNGTEERAWMANWCCRCLHDAFEQANPGSGRGCPLLTTYYCYPEQDIPEWLDTFPEELPYPLGVHPTCINFKPRGWRNPEPKPKPHPPGPDPLFDSPSGPLVYKDVAAEARLALVSQ
jgi:hypothetical protein